MKKSFLMLGVAAMALASCTNEEVLNVADSRAISFDNAFVNNGTRSVSDPSLTASTLQNFDVYGFVTNTDGSSSQIFGKDEITVVTKGENGQWGYTTPPQYWVKNNTYTFGAIAPSKVGTVSGVSVADGKVKMTVSFTNTNNDQKDLLHAAPAAVQVTGDTYSEPVKMTFNHQLSKVKFSFKNLVGAGYSVKVKNVKITNAKKTGTLTIGNTSSWSGQQGELALYFGNAVGTLVEDNDTTKIEYNGTNETYYEKLMIPTPTEIEETGIAYNVTFTAELYQGEVMVGTFDHSVEIKGVEFKLGYCYDFTAELTHENVLDPEKPLNKIEFTVDETITGWNTENQDQELDVPTTQLP